MAALAAEKTRRVARGVGASAEIEYAVLGAETHADAFDAIVAVSPGNLDPYGSGLVYLPRITISVDEVGSSEIWEGRANYAAQAQAGDSADYEFEIGGRTQHINCALTHVADYKRTGDTNAARNHHGLIGVTPEGVEGIDIEVPEYQWSEHLILSAAIVATYKSAWYALYNHVNSLPFKGFAAGECRFRGCTGSRRKSTGDYAMTFQYVASPNRTNITIGPAGDDQIVIDAKRGQDLLWIEFEETVQDDAQAPVKRPVAAHIEQTFWYGDLNALGV